MSKKLYSVSLNLEKQFNEARLVEEVKSYSFCERLEDIVDETFEYYNTKHPQGRSVFQVSKFKEFNGARIILPENKMRFGEHSTNKDLIPEMKKHIVSALILDVQNKYKEAANAYKEFKRYKTSFTAGEKPDRNTFFEQLLLKLTYAKNDVYEYIKHRDGSAENVLINTGISFYNGEVHVYAEPLWLASTDTEGLFELVNETFQTEDEITLNQIGLLTGGERPDFPFANIRVQGEFDIYDIASQLQSKMDEQTDLFLLHAREEMERNISLALELKATI